MTPDFDPYHRWLGIPPKHQPADHYRLLGLERFEADPEVIADAAERQMAHVRRYDLGPHQDISQRVLNELAAAKVCLLQPDKKAEYDRKLQEQVAPQEQAVAEAAQPSPEPLPLVILAPRANSEPAGGGKKTLTPLQGSQVRSRGPRLVKHAWLPWTFRERLRRVVLIAGATGGSILLGLAVVSVWRLSSGDDVHEVAKVGDGRSSAVAPAPIKVTPVGKPQDAPATLEVPITHRASSFGMGAKTETLPVSQAPPTHHTTGGLRRGPPNVGTGTRLSRQRL